MPQLGQKKQAAPPAAESRSLRKRLDAQQAAAPASDASKAAGGSKWDLVNAADELRSLRTGLDNAIKDIDAVSKLVLALSKTMQEQVLPKLGMPAGKDAVSDMLIPGFRRNPDGEGWDINESDVPNWSEEQMITVAKLALNRDLAPHRGQPREVRRRLYEFFASTNPPIIPDDAGPSAKAQAREPAKAVATMPGKLKVGIDGLPEISPIVGKATEDAYPHLDREDWSTDVTPEGKRYIRMHLIAEKFRVAIVEAKAWECQGYNCHDCVEQEETLDQASKCHKYFDTESPKKAAFEFQFPKGTSELVSEDERAYVKKNEAK